MNKKCPCCASDMIGDFKAKLDNSPLANFIVNCKGKSIKTEVWICPKCGKIEFFAQNVSGISKKEG